MKKLNILLFFSLFIFSISSCQKEDDPFEGNDNYITAFSLEKSGVSYPARIIGEQIIIAVGADIDLTDAVVSYEMCENASINPDPASIKSWNDKQQFTVTSYNKKQRTYSFSIIKNEISQSGVVVLKTQADVDLYGQKGISIIDGNLILGEATAYEGLDTIKNINALSSLTKVCGNIVINNSFGGKTLDGLKNLTQAGNVYIGSMTSAASVIDSLDVSLPSLQMVGEITINTPKVKSIAMDHLTSALNVFIDGKSISSLSFASLGKVLGNLTIQAGNNASASTANTKLETVSLSALKEVGGSLTIQGLIAAKQVKLASLSSVGSSLTMSYLSAMDHLEITALSTVGGEITLSNLNVYEDVVAPKLQTIGSFKYAGSYSDRPNVQLNLPMLERVTGNLSIEYTSSDKIDLPALKSVMGQFKINYLEQLTSLSAPSLIECNEIALSSIYKIEKLDFSKVSELKKISITSGYILSEIKLPKTLEDITLNGGSNATSFPVLMGVEDVSGELYISNYKIAEIDISGIKSLGSFKMSVSNLKVLTFATLEEIGIFTLSDYNMTTFNAPKLKKVSKLDWSNFWALTSINLGTLTEVTNELKLWGGTYSGVASKCVLTNLDFLSNLTKVGSVNIKWWNSLVDFTGLKNALSSFSDDKWSVSDCGYSPTYQDMVEGKCVKP